MRQRALVELGMIVAPVDLRPFLERQDALGRDCLYLVSDIEEASRRIQAARRPRPLPDADRGRHRHGGRGGLCRPGAVARRDPRRRRQRRLRHPDCHSLAALRWRAGQAGGRGRLRVRARPPFRAGGGCRGPRRRPRPPGFRDRRRRGTMRVVAPARQAGSATEWPLWSSRRSPRAAETAGRPAADRAAAVQEPGKTDGGGLLRRRRLARHRQGHRRRLHELRACPSSAWTACATSGRRQIAGQVAAATSPGSSPTTATAWQRDRRDPDRLLVRRRRPALRLQPPARGCAAHVRPALSPRAVRQARTSRSTSPAGWASSGHEGARADSARARRSLPKAIVQCFYGAEEDGHRLHAAPS